ncbi:hypothetical protein B0H10DRAFT_2191246 [Mycena sp. CBHHK59/15]|nr:hypothetical protein B0H10DRAFT_2191246 [Mycena sp. CBHHK59/15]
MLQPLSSSALMVGLAPAQHLLRSVRSTTPASLLAALAPRAAARTGSLVRLLACLARAYRSHHWQQGRPCPREGQEIVMDLEGGVTPITTPDAFKVLKLLPVPPKDSKGKAESSAAFAVRNNSNNGILASHLVAMQSKHAALALEVANATRRLEGKMAHVAAGGTITVHASTASEITRLKADLVSLHREMDAIRHSPALHDQVNDRAAHDIVAVSREVSLLANEVKDEFGLVYDDLRDLQDRQHRRTTHDEDFDTLDACMVTLTAANDKLHTTNIDLESKVLVLEGKAAAADAKCRQLELDLLGIRKAIAELQTEAAQRTLASMQKPALAVDTAPASGTGGRSFDLGKGRKRTAPADADAPGSKHAKGIPAEVGDRSDYGHWIRMGPIAPGVSGTPASIFKRMIAVGFESSYAAPIVFVEKDTTHLLIGFVKNSNTTTLVRCWAAEVERFLPKISMTLTTNNFGGSASGSGSGLSAREKEIAALLGN